MIIINTNTITTEAGCGFMLTNKAAFLNSPDCGRMLTQTGPCWKQSDRCTWHSSRGIPRAARHNAFIYMFIHLFISVFTYCSFMYFFVIFIYIYMDATRRPVSEKHAQQNMIPLTAALCSHRKDRVGSKVTVARGTPPERFHVPRDTMHLFIFLYIYLFLYLLIIHL